MTDTVVALTQGGFIEYGPPGTTPFPHTGSQFYSEGSQLCISPDSNNVAVCDDGEAIVELFPVSNLGGPYAWQWISSLGAPWGLAYSPDGTIIYVTDLSGGLSAINASTGAHIWDVSGLGAEYVGICISPDGSTAFVTDFGTDTVDFIDLATQTVTHSVDVIAAGGLGLCVSADGSTVYAVAELPLAILNVIDVASATVTHTVDLSGDGSFATQCALSPSNPEVWIMTGNDNTDTVACVQVVNTNTLTMTHVINIPVMSLGQSGTMSPDGTRFVVGGEDGSGNGWVTLVDTSSYAIDQNIETNTGSTFYAVEVTPSSFPLEITPPAAFGAGYGYTFIPGPIEVFPPAAFGAGYGSPTPTTISPIAPTGANAYLLRTRTARATPTVTIAPAPPGDQGPGCFTVPPPVLADFGIIRSSETFDAPVVMCGLPYADTDRNPWLPASIIEEIWASQLQIIVNGEDVTFFRATPTVVQSWSSQEPFGDASAVLQFPAITSFDQLRQPLAVPTGPTVGMASTYTGEGYWTASALGLVTGFGDASFFGDPLGLLNELITGIAASPVGYGYALCAGDGGVFCFGSVPFEGSLPGDSIVPNRPIVGIALTATGNGYWLLGADGGVFAFGDALFDGSAPIPTGDSATAICRSGNNGYLVVSAAGHVYAFGGATYHGGGEPYYVAPFVGITAWPGVDGYLLVNSLGEAYDFGSLVYEGGVTFPLNAPANAITAGSSSGYWIGAQDGGVFSFNVPFFGSVPGGGMTEGGSTSWMYLGAPIQINAVLADSSILVLFEGVIADWEDAASSGSVGVSVQCVGCLFQLDWYIAKPILNLPFQGYSPDTGNPIFGWDIAQAIPQAIATVTDPSPGTALGTGAVPVARPSPFNGNACILDLPGGGASTGVFTITQPAWDKLLTSYIQNMLSQAQNYGGVQYTVGLQRPRTPILKVKDFETVNWTVSNGGHGVAPDLSLDISTAANAIYGSGTAPPVYSQLGDPSTLMGVAGTWQGAKYPIIPAATPPSFPLGLGSFSPGDGQTGFLAFSNWMRQSGWPLVSQDSYLATNPALGILDYYLILMWQLAAGLEQTGSVDVNTWNLAFFAGTNSGGITNTWYSPLWELAEVEPYTYTPSGAFLGVNPFYNSSVPRIERYEAMGSQVSKAQGVLSAIMEGQRIQVPAWTGTITLTADPQEGSRFAIQSGDNILLRFWHGRDTLFHISAVDVDFTSLSVSLTVSAQPLDLITLAAIYARDTQAHGVSRQARPSLVNLNVSPTTTTFDSESSAGVIAPIVCPAGQWVVVKIPASQSGSVAGTSLTSFPASPFAVAVFSGPVAPADLEAVFTLSGGSPLNDDVAGNNPWNDFATDLDALGLLYAAGGPGAPCGYYPSDPSGTQTLTGQYVDGQTWPYFSAPGYSPWLWVALWSQDDAFISGRFLPAPSSPS